MNPNEREAMSRKMVEFLRKELPGRPFLVTLSVLDYEATSSGEQNHTEIFIEPSEPFTQMSFNRAKILVEATGRGIQMLLNQTTVNIQNIVGVKDVKPKEPETQYG